jgi:hypothetical protein
MLINKLFYFNSRIVIEESNRLHNDLPHIPQLVYMRHIAKTNQLKCPSTIALDQAMNHQASKLPFLNGRGTWRVAAGSPTGPKSVY